VCFVEYNLILFIRQVLLRIVLWNETLQSVTSSHQRHSYILKVLLKIQKQMYSKYVVCVLCSSVCGWVGVFVSGCRCVVSGLGVSVSGCRLSVSGCRCVGEWL
jgi:DMSO reductase anchor subunit